MPRLPLGPRVSDFAQISPCARCRLTRKIRAAAAGRRRLHTSSGEERHDVPPPDRDPRLSGPKTLSTKQIPPQTSDSSSTLRPLPPSAFASYHSHTPVPSRAQLSYSARFFTRGAPTFLLSSPHFRQLPLSTVPEVAFVGRSNVGKSSLLNALLNHTSGHARLAHASSKPGRTRMMNAFGVGGVRAVTSRGVGGEAAGHDKWVGRDALVILDMPGYGHGARADWGTEILKYLAGRRQLRRAFVLIDAEHGVKTSDRSLLRLFRQNGIPHQIVLSKADKLLFPGPTKSLQVAHRRLPALLRAFGTVRAAVQPEDGFRGLRPLDDILACSSSTAVPPDVGSKIGIDALRWAVLSATGLDCDVHGNKRLIEYDLQVEDEDESGASDHVATSRW